MKYAFVLFLSVMVFQSPIFGQTSKELIGKWKLVKMTDASGKPKSIQEVYKTDDVFQAFDADGKFHGIVGKKSKDGKWTLSADNKELIVKISIISVKFDVVYFDAQKRTIYNSNLGTLEYEKVAD